MLVNGVTATEVEPAGMAARTDWPAGTGFDVPEASSK
jgi:hypothetical protein